VGNTQGCVINSHKKMTTPGFLQQSFDPRHDAVWFSRERLTYVQREIARRLQQSYVEYIEVPLLDLKIAMQRGLMLARGNPPMPDALAEQIIEEYVRDYHTEFQQQRQFVHCDPKTLYFPGTGITREERVKLKPSYKFEFQMNY
jgi:hypothetical protein